MIRRVASLALSLLTAFQLSLASAAEANLWQQRRAAKAPTQYAALPMGVQAGPGAALLRQMPDLQRQVVRPDAPTRRADPTIPTEIHAVLEKVPRNAGEIREVYVAEKSRDLVLLIQDVHLHREAQANISSLLLSFGPEPMVVGVEGASGKFDRTLLQDVADPAVRKAVADSFLRDNEISAVSHAGIVAPRGALELIGIDDAGHYAANVSAYRDAVIRKTAVTTAMNEEERILLDAKRRTLRGEIARFDQLRTEYEKNAIGLGVYLERLSRFRERLDGAFLDAGEIDRFLAAFHIEKELNFQQVERQRTAVMQDLVAKASQKELSDVLAQTLAYRAGAISYADFYRYLDAQLKGHGVSLQKSPAFKRYIEYVLMADTIKPERVLEAMDALEAAVAGNLAQTPEERALLSQSRSLFLRRKLVEFGLTWPEWRQYRSQRKPGMEDFEKFYTEADVRSEHMVDALLGAVDKQSTAGSRRAAMVAGGFHTPELTARLKSRGVSYAVIQPRITRVDGSGTEYLSIFVREKTPLEKIFEGQKLFLAPAAILAGFPAARAVTEQMSMTGKAIEAKGAAVPSAANPALLATTGAQPAATRALGSKDVAGYGIVRYFMRVGGPVAQFFSRAARALNLVRITGLDSARFLVSLERDAETRGKIARAIGLPSDVLFRAVAATVQSKVRTNEQLLSALQAFRPKNLPVGVPLHLNSHQDLITSLVERGRNRTVVQRARDRWNGVPEFTPGMAIVARMFVESHDLGYAIDYSNRETFEKEYRADLITAWSQIAEAARYNPDARPDTAAEEAAKANDLRLAEKAYGLIAPPLDGKQNYMLQKVLAHGSTSIVLALRRFQAEGFSPREAMGMALLFAAHHPGFPITLVDQFVVPGMVPSDLLQVLLITDLKPGTTERGNPDDLRMRIADFVADTGLLKMSRAEARQIAVMGYALDRITPARRMRDFFFDSLQFKEDGKFDKVKPESPDFWTGGETSKKYPLIVTNVKSFTDLNVRNIYNLTLGNVQKEANAAIDAADRAAQGLTDREARPLAELKAITKEQSDQEIAATKEIQDKALAYMDRALNVNGASFGNIANIESDIARLAANYRAMNGENPDREAAGYLLGTLVSMRLSPLVAPHVARLKADYDEVQRVAIARADPTFQAMQRAVAAHVERHESMDEFQAPLILSMLGEFERTGVEGVSLGVALPGEVLVEQTPEGRTTEDRDVFITYDGTLDGVNAAGVAFKVEPGSVVGERAVFTGNRNATLRVPADGTPVRYVRVSADLVRRLAQKPSFLEQYEAIRDRRMAPQPVAEPGITAEMMEAALEDPTMAMSWAATSEASMSEEEIRERLLGSASISARQGAAELELVTAVLEHARANPQDNLLAQNRIQRLESGQQLFAHEDQSDDLYLVLEGQLTVVNGVVITREARNVIGEMALTNGGRRTATVTGSVGGARVLKIPGSVLRALLADPQVYASYRKLVLARLDNQRALGAPITYQGQLGETPATLTGNFAMNLGRMLLSWLPFSQATIDRMIRLGAGLFIELPIFVVALFIPGVMRWFVNDHFGPNGLADNAANRQRIVRGVAIIYGFSALGLAVGIVAGFAFGFPTADLLKVGAIGFAIGNLLSHFGVNLKRLLEKPAAPSPKAPPVVPQTEIEREIAAVMRPLEANAPVDKAVIGRLIAILTPKADRALGLADAARASAIAALTMRLGDAARPTDGEQALTAGELADIVSLMVVLTNGRASVNLNDQAVRQESSDPTAPSTFVRVPAAKTKADVEIQVALLRQTKAAADVGVLILTPALFDAIVADPSLAASDIRFAPNDDRLDLSAAGLEALTGLKRDAGRIQITLSRQASLTDQLIQQVERLKQSDPTRVAVFLLLDEALRAMPLAIEQLNELVRVHRLIAIQA